MAWKLQIPLVFVHDLATKELSREVMLGPNQSSHDKILWKLATGATQLLRKVFAFKMGLDNAGSTDVLRKIAMFSQGIQPSTYKSAFGTNASPKR